MTKASAAARTVLVQGGLWTLFWCGTHGSGPAMNVLLFVLWMYAWLGGAVLLLALVAASSASPWKRMPAGESWLPIRWLARLSWGGLIAMMAAQERFVLAAAMAIALIVSCALDDAIRDRAAA